MKICLISHLWGQFIAGGLEVYLPTLAEALSKYHQVTIVATSPFSGWDSLKGEEERNDAVKVIRFFPLNLYYGYGSLRKSLWLRVLWNAIQAWNPHSYVVVRNILKREKPDIVHTHGVRFISPSIFSAVSSLGIPCVHSLHSYELLSLWSTLFRRHKVAEIPDTLDIAYAGLMRFLARNIRAVTADTQFVLDLHLKRGLFTKAKRYVIPAGFSISSNDESAKDYETLDILFVGGLHEHKGIHILLNAFKSLTEPNVLLHIVGQGPLAELVSSFASQDKRVRYYGFIPPGEELWRLYAKANLLVFPSTWLEPLGIVSIEALSFGTPVIASAIGGIREVIQDGYNGLLFKPGDVEDLTRTLKRALSDTELLRKLGKNARESAQRYNLESHIESLLKVYEEVLK